MLSSDVIKSSLSIVQRESIESSRNADQFKTTGQGLQALTQQIDDLVRSFETQSLAYDFRSGPGPTGLSRLTNWALPLNPK
jgi:hypothetical protein